MWQLAVVYFGYVVVCSGPPTELDALQFNRQEVRIMYCYRTPAFLFQTAENLRIRGLADVDASEEDIAASSDQHSYSNAPSKLAKSRSSPSKIGRTTPNNNVAPEKTSFSTKVGVFAFFLGFANSRNPRH